MSLAHPCDRTLCKGLRFLQCHLRRKLLHRKGGGSHALCSLTPHTPSVRRGSNLPRFPGGGNKDKITKWCKDYFDALHPYSAGGAYVNFMMEEGQERVKASFLDNYDRLAGAAHRVGKADTEFSYRDEPAPPSSRKRSPSAPV